MLLAIAIHAAMATAFLGAIAPSRFDWLMRPSAGADTASERVRYVVMPPPSRAQRVEPVVREPRRQRVRAEPASASALPMSADAMQPGIPGVPPGDPGNAGRDGSARGTAVVLVPGSADPRIWSAKSDFGPTAPSTAQALESTLARDVRASNDSVAALGVQTVRPDWVATRGGERFGVDNKAIHLGKAKVPAVLLGLLPISGFGCMPAMYFPDRAVRDSIGISCMQLENQTVADRMERINEMSAEIRARAAGMAASRAEISRIAARNDREREARLRAGATSSPEAPRLIPPP